MLFCLNPPHSLPFPHWPDGATLPAAAAADVSLVALAPPAPTSRPQAHCSSARTLQPGRGSCKLAGTHGARGARGLGGGDARTRRQLALVWPLQSSAEVGGTRGPSWAEESGGGGCFPFLFQSSPGATRGLALKKSRKSCLPPGERSRSSLCLESQHLRWLRLQCVPGDISTGQTGRRRGIARFSTAFRGVRAGDFCAFVFICGNLSLSFFFFLLSPAAGHVLIWRPRLPPRAADQSRLQRVFPPSLSLTLQHRSPGGPTSARKEARGEPRIPEPKP